MKLNLIFLIVALLSIHKAKAQTVNKIKLFIECNNSSLCDMDYIRNEISITDFVRDPFIADVHIILLSQQTGSGGKHYTIIFRVNGLTAMNLNI